jgi:uncharacterized sulfatase
VGCYDRRAIGTPSIDRLAAGGVRFERAYTTCPVCSPARGAIFTGLYPHSNGVWGNEMAIGRDTLTLGERLAAEGVHAAYVGKWHLSATDYFDTGRCPPGWDARYWFDGRNHLDSLPEEMRRWSREYHTPEEIRAADYTREKTFAGGVTDRAVEFLGAHGEEEFCLCVSYDEPHHPSIAPAPFCDLYGDYRFDVGPAHADDLAGKPEHHRAWARDCRRETSASWREQGQYVLQPYFACNTFVDDEIGRVVEAVEANAPDALVIYTSDHGEMMWAHRLNSKGPVMYEQITRIPMLLHGQGIAPGRTLREPVSHIDITPTILDYFSLELPPILQGRSLLERVSSPGRGASIGSVAGPAPATIADAAGDAEAGAGAGVFLEFNRHNVNTDGYGGFQPIRCVLDGRYKLVVNLLDRDELYDLHTDPHELRNLIDEPSVAAHRGRLHAALTEWMDETRDPFRGPGWLRRHWMPAGEMPWPHARRPRLPDGVHPPALGYLTGMPAE